ncbi:MAG: ParB N-terminal domain-containing protein [Planctomycetota bacterium]
MTRTAQLDITTRRIDDLTLSNEYLRRDTDVEALKRSLESIGLIHPVSINSEGELLAGARRLQAARELGWEEIAVQVVDRTGLEQELISIDENLVRKPLKGLELERCLNRGREIYEELHPDAAKVELEPDAPKKAAASAEPEPRADDDAPAEDEDAEDALQSERQVDIPRPPAPPEPAAETSFAAITSAKTGLSPAVIQSAIRRDALASDAVKKARSHGDLNATQTNELIRLEKDVQAEVLPLIADRTVKDARRIVNAARTGGIDAAREEAERIVPLPREYRQILGPVKRVNRSIGRILAENLEYDGPEREAIDAELRALKDFLEQYFAPMRG